MVMADCSLAVHNLHLFCLNFEHLWISKNKVKILVKKKKEKKKKEREIGIGLVS